MKFSRAIALALANAALLVDATVFMTEPISGTKWTFGKVETCKWRAEGETGAKNLELFFRNGAPETAFQGTPIYKVQIPDITAGSVKVDLTQIDKSKFPPSGSDYFIRIGADYSSTFTINGGTGSSASSGAATGAATGASSAKPVGGATGATGAAGTAGGKVVPVVGKNNTSPVSNSTITKTVASGKATSDAKTTVTYSAFAVVAAVIAAFM